MSKTTDDIKRHIEYKEMSLIVMRITMKNLELIRTAYLKYILNKLVRTRNNSIFQRQSIIDFSHNISIFGIIIAISLGIVKRGKLIAHIQRIYKKIFINPLDFFSKISKSSNSTINTASNIITASTISTDSLKEKDLANNDEFNPSFNDSRWKQIGKIINLNIQPLTFGKSYNVTKCTFTVNGIEMTNENGFVLRDKMFVVYEQESKVIVNSDMLANVDVKAVNKFQILFECKHLKDSLLVNINECSNITTCALPSETYIGYYIKVINCKESTNKWITNALKNKNLCLGYCIKDLSSNSSYNQSSQPTIRNLSQTDNKHLNGWKHLPIYVMNLQKQGVSINGISDMQKLRIYPNIQALNEVTMKNWQWMKIGKTVLKICSEYQNSQSNLILMKGNISTYKNNTALIHHWHVLLCKSAGYVNTGDIVEVL